MATTPAAHVEGNHPQQLPPHTKQERQHRVINQGHPSLAQSIAHALVTKEQDVFLVTDRNGEMPPQGAHGFGLYYHDCRFLDGYEVKLAGERASLLASTVGAGFKAELELTNPDIRMEDGKLLAKEQLGIRWQRTIDSSQLALHDLLTFRNYGQELARFPLAINFSAHFEPVFVVRGAAQDELGKLYPPQWQDGVLCFRYDGTDKVCRSTSIHFSEKPHQQGDREAEFHLSVPPGQGKELLISIVLAESPNPDEVGPQPHEQPDLKVVEGSLHRSVDQWLGQVTDVASKSQLLDRILERSLRDLRALRSKLQDKLYLAAGVPWYVTLFGRDSIIASLQSLAFEPEVAAQTLRLLADFQGTEVNAWRDEQPGKIMHELRVGELAHTNRIPQTPYYGSIDATPLFLILICRHAAWTGDLALFNELRGNVERALEWMAKYGDTDGDGYLDYQCASKKGLSNQGWKDSGDAIMNADGSLARPPIALVEVQGYAYLAKCGLAELYRRAGDSSRAGQLLKEAEDLRRRFNRDFWLEDLEFYALALQAGGKPCAVVASNPGQALWSGIADPDKAQKTVKRLLTGDMFSGWGIRTLSEQAVRYNPIGYHLGTVWPHDNALLVAGFRRYGFDAAATRVFTGIVDAAAHFSAYRLPEVFAGFRRGAFGVPVHYPVACHPQAWAAGSVPFMVTTLLGLTPEAFQKRLRIVRPVLPDFIDHLELRGLRVGKASTDLKFERSREGPLAVEILKINGQLDVAIEPAEARASG